jgi:hypothetical protein
VNDDRASDVIVLTDPRESDVAPVWGEVELLEERVRSIDRTGQRLERLLGEMQELTEELDRLEIALCLPGLNDEFRSGVEVEIDIATDAFNHLREAAAGAFRQLIHQRERCGFRGHAAVERCYPIPELRLPLTPEPYEIVEQ